MKFFFSYYFQTVWTIDDQNMPNIMELPTNLPHVISTKFSAKIQSVYVLKPGNFLIEIIVPFDLVKADENE